MTKNCFDCNGDKDFGCEDCLNKSKGDLISREALRKAFHERIYYFNKSSWDEANALIDSAETVDINQPAIWWNGYDTGKVIGEHERPQKVVTIPHELIEKLVLCVVDTVENIDWDKAIEAYKERPTGKWIEQTDYVGDTYYECSVCKEPWTTIEGTPMQNFINYCPKCGARMEEDNDNK